MTARHPTPRRARLALALLGAALGAGCAGFSADGGFGTVEQTTRERIAKEVRWARTPAEQEAIDRRVDELLGAPLDADAAVQLALLSNRGLQSAFANLGIAEADLVQAGRLPNPGFSFARASRGDVVEIERGLHLNLARLVAMPLLREVESRRFAHAQARAAEAVLALAADARRAWVQAVAAEEGVRYAAQVHEAAAAGAELARRMAEAGNFNTLQHAREQAFQADAALAVARAQQARVATRERLVRLLGLWGEPAAKLRLPERLPALPAAPRELPDLERRAIAGRLDVQGARLAAERTARDLGLVRTTRFVDVLELGVVRNSETGEPPQRGYEVGLELPLFDWGTARVARAEAAYMQTLHAAAQTAIDARSEVREAWHAYRGAWDIARHHRDTLLPLRQRIAEQNLLRYNGMLIGVFDLLADARAQIAGVQASIDALRDFWLSEATLDMALVGRPMLSLPASAPSAAPAAGDGDAH